MANKLIPASSLSNVSVGGVAVLKLDTGPTYNKILLKFSAAALFDVTDIEYIRVVINGTTRIEFASLQDLLDVNAFYNRSADVITATSGEVMLNFFSNQFADLAYGLSTGLGTADLASLNIEIKIAAAAPATIAITADLFIDTTPQPLGAFLAYRSYGVSSSVIGDVQVRDLPKDGAIYTALHLFKSDISNVVIKANQVEIINASKASLERFAKDSWPFKRVPVTARCTHVDFLSYGNANDVFNTLGVTSLQLTAKFDSVGSLRVLAETLETL
jgi:hypothetical protein